MNSSKPETGKSQANSRSDKYPKKHTLGHQPRKRFGQNFLHDPHVIHAILSAIASQKDDHLVEIGPGLGALTEGLLSCCNSLDVVELDRDLIPRLQTRFGDHPQFNIHHSDALKFDFTSLGSTDNPIRIVGNLPYNISTPLIFHLLKQCEVVQDMHFMLQREVVDRLCAGVGESAYGRLGIMVQYHCEVHKVLNVGPGAFSPPPKVDSAVVKLTPYIHKPIHVENMDLLSLVVAGAFNQRRKTIKNGLKKMANISQIQQAGIDPNDRAERITLKQFAHLANLLHTKEQ